MLRRRNIETEEDPWQQISHGLRRKAMEDKAVRVEVKWGSHKGEIDEDEGNRNVGEVWQSRGGAEAGVPASDRRVGGGEQKAAEQIKKGVM